MLSGTLLSPVPFSRGLETALLGLHGSLTAANASSGEKALLMPLDAIDFPVCLEICSTNQLVTLHRRKHGMRSTHGKAWSALQAGTVTALWQWQCGDNGLVANLQLQYRP